MEKYGEGILDIKWLILWGSSCKYGNKLAFLIKSAIFGKEKSITFSKSTLLPAASIFVYAEA